MSYSPWGRKELDITERLMLSFRTVKGLTFLKQYGIKMGN